MLPHISITKTFYALSYKNITEMVSYFSSAKKFLSRCFIKNFSKTIPAVRSLRQTNLCLLGIFLLVLIVKIVNRDTSVPNGANLLKSSTVSRKFPYLGHYNIAKIGKPSHTSICCWHCIGYYGTTLDNKSNSSEFGQNVHMVSWQWYYS